MVVEIRQVYRNQAVELIEHQLEHRQLSVKKLRHSKPFYHLPHHSEGQSFLLVHSQVQETCNKIHSLTVVEVRIDNCISLEDVFKRILLQVLHVVERPYHVYVDGVRDLLVQLQLLLLLIDHVLRVNKTEVNLEDVQPELLSFAFNVLNVSSHQTLFEYFFSKNLVHVFA